jgi:hypothetical protein
MFIYLELALSFRPPYGQILAPPLTAVYKKERRTFTI